MLGTATKGLQPGNGHNPKWKVDMRFGTWRIRRKLHMRRFIICTLHLILLRW